MKRFIILVLAVVMAITCSCTEVPNEEAEAPNIEAPESPGAETSEAEVPEADAPKGEDPVIKLPEIELPEIELPNIELPEIELPEIKLPEELPEINIPEIELPEIKLPEELPEINIPEIELPEIDLPEIELPFIKKPELTVEATVDKTISFTSASTVAYNGEIKEDYEERWYDFTPDIDGVYRFELCDLSDFAEIRLFVYDKESGAQLGSKAFPKERDGCTLKLEAGKTYNAVIKATAGSYTLKIWNQKPTADVSDYTLIEDCIDFEAQEILYTFTPKVSGAYRFESANKDGTAEPSIYIEDSLGHVIINDMQAVYGDGVTGDNLLAGETYTVRIKQYQTLGNYTLKIGLQKPTVDITEYSAVHDSLTFSGQRNVYTFTPEKSQSYTFSLTYPDGYNHGISIHVYDSEGNQLTHRDYCLSGDSVSISAAAGQTYVINVSHYLLSVDYTLGIAS